VKGRRVEGYGGGKNGEVEGKRDEEMDTLTYTHTNTLKQAGTQDDLGDG
jgi:hypothetical protein